MLRLYIGNKNYSSWSLRAWLLLKGLGIPFEEEVLELFTEEFQRRLTALGAPPRVPMIVHDERLVWDSLSIVEYIAETHPDIAVWPVDRGERAWARSYCAEMHAGFQGLRGALPMNIEADLPGGLWTREVHSDIARVQTIWQQARGSAGARQGPFLFGAFGAVDAYFAPVVSRFKTYHVELSPVCAAYAQAVLDHPAMIAWTQAALTEQRYLPEDEPYRRAR